MPAVHSLPFGLSLIWFFKATAANSHLTIKEKQKLSFFCHYTSSLDIHSISFTPFFSSSSHSLSVSQC